MGVDEEFLLAIIGELNVMCRIYVQQIQQLQEELKSLKSIEGVESIEVVDKKKK